MKFLALALLISSPFASAALDMKPGLWQMNMRVKTDGKNVNPSETMKTGMTKMSDEEKKKMLSLMGKMDTNVGPNGETNVCYSKNVIDKPEAIIKRTPDCEMSLVTNTGEKVVSNFKCKDGTTGDATWDMKSQQNMIGLINVRDPKGKTSQVTYDGKFVNADCGKVKAAL